MPILTHSPSLIKSCLLKPPYLFLHFHQHQHQHKHQIHTPFHTMPPSNISGKGSGHYTTTNSVLASSDIDKFRDVLGRSRRVLALCGAGLSAASGLDTFRGKGGFWRDYKATSLATPEAFEADPGLVWLFYAYRRHKALQAKPNMAHFALAELARKRGDGFLCLSQNVDGLSQRANHPPSQLKLLHSTLFNLKCHACTYIQTDNFDDPVHPSLLIDDASITARLSPAKSSVAATARLLDPNSPKTIDPADLPHCPECKTGLLRPGVVWFGEPLPEETLREVNEWIDEGRIDLILVIGTTAAVWPAAGYIQQARQKGAKVAVVNMDTHHLGSASSLRKGDFLFVGDAATLVPEMLEPVVGDLREFVGQAAVPEPVAVEMEKEKTADVEEKREGEKEEV
ncbi:hypothetical protein HYFRA_00008278 [Hymenoscyphus fraxineus]|uniref:Deacetylase sirtuin-type domain-containing protein n=1 Tax=Hymenoscyphus fraxineus TaxID=746836 RepID=A0A9N9PKL4_9HELO|nr:hypothetical protein HYFRA_00008278 [Hymenoscyphus fraxineus]